MKRPKSCSGVCWFRHSATRLFRLTLSAHVAALFRSGYYQLRQLRPLVQSMTVEAARTAAAAFIPADLIAAICCSTVCRTLYCAGCSLCRMPLHD